MDGKHQVLQEYFGYDTFRPGQGELIDALLSGPAARFLCAGSAAAFLSAAGG